CVGGRHSYGHGLDSW
nr:immunoglobulin heavy chain junction region [Macaca mulatta]MOX96630.1 immunoglobulin heavy chain junction region [Macaca mulatta]